MRILIFSATSLIAQHCARIWLEDPQNSLVLVGRDHVRIKSVADDLRVRFPLSTITILVGDLSTSLGIEELVNEAFRSEVDLALVAQGSLTNQHLASTDLSYLEDQLQLNGISVAVTAEAIVARFANQGSGSLGVIGSVAGDRGRAYNYAYGASKALLETFVEGLQQRLAKPGISVSLIKPGPTATPMTATHKGKMSLPADVAKIIVTGLSKRRRVIYAPSSWRLIMFVVRNIPFLVFKHLHF
jgi:decaprenylphospho-beta-D-erythro-pentofuranosid-2-ulose 2-reductase